MFRLNSKIKIKTMLKLNLTENSIFKTTTTKKQYTAYTMPEYGFSLSCISQYKDKIYDFVLIRENTGQIKLVL